MYAFLSRKHSCGFSIIELLIVLLIVGVFALAAIPAYQHYRTAAFRQLMQAELLETAGKLEASYSFIDGYHQIATFLFPPQDPKYRVVMTMPENHSYRIIATPLAGQVGDGLLYLDSSGERRRYNSNDQNGSYSDW